MLIIFVLLAGVAVFWWWNGGKAAMTSENNYQPPVVQLPDLKVYSGVGYEGVDTSKFGVELFAKNLGDVAQLRMSPDNEYLLAIRTDGQVLVFNREKVGWASTPYLLLRGETGLNNIVWSGRYHLGGKMFLLGDGWVKEYKVREENNKLVTSGAEWGFALTGNEKIYDGDTMDISGVPYLLLLADKKILVIKEDGTGSRSVNLELGVNQALARNLFENEGRHLLASVDGDGAIVVNYAKLVDIRNRQFESSPTKLATIPGGGYVAGLGWHAGGVGVIERAIEHNNNAVLGVGGLGEVWLGRLSWKAGVAGMTWEPMVRRAMAAAGKEYRLAGVVVDPQTGGMFFGDGREGRIYKIVLR